jgi:hypothetical protein
MTKGNNVVGATHACRKKVYPEMSKEWREAYIERAVVVALRDVNMYESYQKGDVSFDKLATIYDLSRERIRQIIGVMRAELLKTT